MKNAELPFEVKEMMNQIEFKDFEGFIEEFKRGFQVKGLIIGNIIESDIRKIGNFLKKSLPKPEKALKTNSPKRKHINFTNKSLEYFELSDNKNDKNSGILNIYMKKGYSHWDMRLLKALVEIFHNRAFYYLRTKKQLGYIVFSKIYSNKDFAGLGILIQGSRHNPLEMDQEIENFIRSFKKYIHNPKNRSLFEEKKKKAKKQTRNSLFLDYSLNDRAENLWGTGLSQEKKRKSKKGLKGKKKIDWEDLKQFFDELFFMKRQKVSLKIISPMMKTSRKGDINNPEDLRKMAANFQGNN